MPMFRPHCSAAVGGLHIVGDVFCILIIPTAHRPIIIIIIIINIVCSCAYVRPTGSTPASATTPTVYSNSRSGVAAQSRSKRD